MESEREQVAALFGEERELRHILSQPTRHYIVQIILAHPKHLMSLAELDYAIAAKSTSTIRSQLNQLIDADIVAEYTHEPSDGTRDLPTKFYGFTNRGVEVLTQFGYIDALPILRAMYDSMDKPSRVRRHEDAPRPNLPDSIVEALSFDEVEE